MHKKGYMTIVDDNTYQRAKFNKDLDFLWASAVKYCGLDFGQLDKSIERTTSWDYNLGVWKLYLVWYEAEPADKLFVKYTRKAKES